MKNQIWKLALVTASAGILAACGNSQTNTDSQDQTATSSDGAQVVQIAHTQAFVPYDYVDDQGNSTGLEVEIMRAVDEKLDDYDFEFVPTSDDDLLIGVQSGKYAGGTKGIWITEERLEDYIFPENPVAASNIGLVYRTEDEELYGDIDSFAANDGRLVPIAPQNAQYSVIQEYNENNPENPIDLTPAEQFQNADAYAWVVEGRYDGHIDIELLFESAVQNPEGAYYEYADQLSYTPFRWIPTYLIVNQDYQDLADQYDQAYQELVEDGTISELSLEFLGVDVVEEVEAQEISEM